MPSRRCATCKNFEKDLTGDKDKRLCYFSKELVPPNAYCSVYNPLHGPLPKGP